MSRTVYVNGNYLPENEAKISVFDRAVLFADAVYEGIGVLQGKLLDFAAHYSRLQRSLSELCIPQTISKEEIIAAHRQLVRVNYVEEGLVYMQITRGEADRGFTYKDNLTPNIFMFTQIKPQSEKEKGKRGIRLQTFEDIRWARRDIKSVNLLGQVMAKQYAKQQGVDEALLVGRDGAITECGSSSFFFLKGETIITRPLSNDILPGVTRQAVLTLCAQYQISLKQQHFTLQQALGADEAFISGASAQILPVVMIDGRSIGSGKPGAICERLRNIYMEHALRDAI